MSKTSLSWGAWAFPIWPVTRSLVGSRSTPYLFQDIVDPQRFSQSLVECSQIGSAELKERGLKGREFALINFNKDLIESAV